MTFDDLRLIVHELCGHGVDTTPPALPPHVLEAQRLADEALTTIHARRSVLVEQRAAVRRRLDVVQAGLAAVEAQRAAAAQRQADARLLAELGVTPADTAEAGATAQAERRAALLAELAQLRSLDGTLGDEQATLDTLQQQVRTALDRATVQAAQAQRPTSLNEMVAAMHRGTGARVSLLDARQEGTAWVAWLRCGEMTHRVDSLDGYTGPASTVVETRPRHTYMQRPAPVPNEGLLSLAEVADVLARSHPEGLSPTILVRWTQRDAGGRDRYLVTVAHGRGYWIDCGTYTQYESLIGGGLPALPAPMPQAEKGSALAAAI